MFFVPHGGSLVGFYGRDGLAEMVGVSADSNGFSGVVFDYIVRSEGRVNEVMDEAKKAGAKILKPAASTEPFGRSRYCWRLRLARLISKNCVSVDRVYKGTTRPTG